MKTAISREWWQIECENETDSVQSVGITTETDIKHSSDRSAFAGNNDLQRRQNNDEEIRSVRDTQNLMLCGGYGC